jgi:Rod binding domain-containing protein
MSAGTLLAVISGLQTPLRQSDAVASKLSELREATGSVVGSVFYGTLLKNLRASELKGEYGHGGRGEEVFQAQLDQTLADQAGQAASFNLADIIVQQYEPQVRMLVGQSTCCGDNS